MGQIFSRSYVKLSVLALFWLIWFSFYAWLNARGAKMGIHWVAPDIYIPLMVYPYVFGMLILVFLPFIYNFSTSPFYRLIGLYTVTSIIMFAVYFFYPVYILRREYGGSLVSDFLMRMIVGMDDPANTFPSNHCSVATLGYIGVQISRAPNWMKLSSLILAILVSLSTVLVGQHYWVDVPAGIGLSAGVFFLYSRFIKIR